jgi:hypothetical protein
VGVLARSVAYSPEEFEMESGNGNLSITLAPEPQTWLLVLSGLTFVIFLKRKRVAVKSFRRNDRK